MSNDRDAMIGTEAPLFYKEPGITCLLSIKLGLLHAVSNLHHPSIPQQQTSE